LKGDDIMPSEYIPEAVELEIMQLLAVSNNPSEFMAIAGEKWKEELELDPFFTNVHREVTVTIAGKVLKKPISITR
jgi:hypothetical protein